MTRSEKAEYSRHCQPTPNDAALPLRARAQLHHRQLQLREEVDIVVTVTNTGDRAGDGAVITYLPMNRYP